MHTRLFFSFSGGGGGGGGRGTIYMLYKKWDQSFLFTVVLFMEVLIISGNDHCFTGGFLIHQKLFTPVPLIWSWSVGPNSIGHCHRYQAPEAVGWISNPLCRECGLWRLLARYCTKPKWSLSIYHRTLAYTLQVLLLCTVDLLDLATGSRGCGKDNYLDNVG